MPNLPSGTVTFLFTDIAGSTALWERQPEAMAAAGARHDAILHGAVEAHGGHVFRRAGDAVCAAFATAAPAVATAAMAQQSLYAEPWPLYEPLRVRMALHSVEAQPVDGDYGGGGLNRLGRLLAVTHGGQVLLTQATEQLSRDHLPAGASLLDLGQHRLRDLAQPDHIFQLVAPGLLADFPPLKTLDALPNNLPAQLTSFVGRERELAQVVARLSAAADGRGERLLTLTGPGGTGKTRLSLQAAAELLDHYPDGVWLVELAPLADPLLVASAIAGVLRLREVANRPMDALLADTLRDQRLLLVLDNCEHLIDECARVADLLLRRCPALRILASSREPLGIAGEAIYRVPSLAIPDPNALPPLDELARYESIQLFAERAASVQPAFHLTAHNAPAVAQISCRLDGIPLALELAAARVRSLSPEQIAARLDDRFRLLTGGSRAAVQRQQTLQALIDWSYDLLSPAECTLLRRLAVFAGGWTLEAAEGVCAWGEVDALDVLDLLDRLVGKSLVIADGGDGAVRYRMQETIRQYAQDKLVAAGEATEARARHMAFLAAELARSEQRYFAVERSRWLPWVRQEQDNLRAAVEWALETDLPAALTMIFQLGMIWPNVASTTEGRRLAARAIAQAEARGDWQEDSLTPERRLQLAGAWIADGFMANMVGAAAAARSAMERAIALLRPLGDSDRLAAAYSFAAMGAFFGGDFAAAARNNSEALRLARLTGNRWIEATQLMATLMVNVFDPASARLGWSNWADGMAILRDLGDDLGLAMGYNAAGNAALMSGDLASAKAYYEQSIAPLQEAGYLRTANIARSGLADIARRQGDYGRALALYPEVIRVWRLMDHRGAIARCLECVGFIAQAQAGETPDPLPLLRRAATLFAAADAMRRANDMPMAPWEQPEYDGHVAALRSLLDPDELARAWQAGGRMDLDQAVAFATD